ncbi:hypothetical protein RUND412_009271 [Rhizina undulata]
MTPTNIAQLPMHLLIGMLSACHNRQELKNLCRGDTDIMEAYLGERTAISKAVFLTELEQPIFEIIYQEEDKMEETFSCSFHLAMFNSHPNGLVKLKKHEVKGVFIYYSLIIRLYTLEVAYYEAVLREDPESPVVEGYEHPSEYFFDEYTYKDLFLICRCSLQSSVKLDHASKILLRDELERKRVAQRIELEDKDRKSIFFPSRNWLDRVSKWAGQAAR